MQLTLKAFFFISNVNLRRRGQAKIEEILETDRNDTLLLSVPRPERLREALNLHTGHDELIDGDLLPLDGIVLCDQKLDKLRRKAESHLSEG